MKNFLATRSVIATLLFISLLSNKLVSQAQDVLYGLTQNGGFYDQGVPYQINTNGSNFIPFGHFDAKNGGKAGNGSGFIQTTLSNGLMSGITAMTASGDQDLNLGMRVTVNPGEGGLIPPFRFQFSEDNTGTNPEGRFLQASNGMLYGLTSTKGQFNRGSLFIANVYGGDYPSAAISFDGDNGDFPKGSLIEGPNGIIYGMTELGGTNNKGVIFSFQNSGSQNFIKLFDFNGAVTGANPTGNLLLASDGKLYGMTHSGGSSDNGVIFSINTDGTGFTKLMDFNGTNTGSAPMGSLVQFTDGKLYGLTSSGGANGFGTIFNITLSGTFTKVLNFNGANGKSPVGDLLTSTSGNIMYGVTYSGGINDKGVLFKLENGSLFTKIYDFIQATGSNPVGTLMMKRKLPQITFPAIGQKTMLTEPFAPDVQTSSGLPIYYTSSDPSVAVIENNRVKIVGAGGVYITAYQLGNHEYLPVASQQTLSVVKADQTISFSPIPTKTFGDAPFTFTASSSSGLPVTFTAFSNNVVTFNGTVFTIIGAGQVTIRAVQPGNSIYNSAAVDQELVVDRASQTINFNPSAQQTCCQSFSLSASSSSGIPVKFKTPDWEKLDINGSLATIYEVGVAEIIAYNDGNNNYKPAEKHVTVNLLKGFQNISFNIPNGTFKFGDADLYVGPGINSNLPITFTSNPPGIAVIEGPYLKFIGVGTTTITATQNGNSLLYAAPQVVRTVTVNPPLTPGTGNTITWNDLMTRSTIDPPFNFSGKSSSGLPVSYTSSNTAVAEVIGNLVTIKGAGSTTIIANQSGDATTPAATPSQKTLTVSKQNQVIFLPSISPISYGAPPIQMPSRSSVHLPLTYTTSNQSVAYVDDDYQLHITGSGSVTISAYQTGNGNYFAASPATILFTVLPLSQSIVFNPLAEKTFGDAPFTLTATATSGLPVTFISSNSSIASIVGSTVTINSVGTITITARQTGVPGYNFIENTRQLVIAKANQVITFAELPQKKFSDEAFTVLATSNVGLPVTFSSSNSSVAKVAGNKIVILGTGTVEIIATQAGNQNYNASEVKRTLQITDSGGSYNIFGSTYGGGPNASGTIFSMKSDGTDYTIVKQFAPRTLPLPLAGFIKGIDGKMYGNFNWGGMNNEGRLVRLEQDGSGLTVLHDYDFANGASPNGNVIQGSDGNIYSMTQAGGQFGGGSIIKVNNDGTGFIVLHHFQPLEGNSPFGGLVEASNGKLYGMTYYGGFYANGSIFSINKDGSDFAVIYRFNDGSPFNSGGGPRGDLVQGVDGYLYGTLSIGGDFGKGILFKIWTDGSDFTKLIKFDGLTMGGTPGATPLIASNGKIYGTTLTGGSGGLGTIYSVNTDGTNFVSLFNFDGTNTAASGLSKLTEGSDGKLYGMTNYGGANSLGTIFRINKNGTGFQKLIDFDSRASSPYYGPLLEVTPGNFFGMTHNGGAANGGAIFSITSSGVFTVIKDFPQQESNPLNLLPDNLGEFYYGIAVTGGVSGNGGLFRISASGEYQQILELPLGVSANQIYYITTGYIWCLGSQNGQPLVFRVKTDGTEYQALTEITSNIGTSGLLWLAEAQDGKVIGVTTSNYFSVNTDGTGFTLIANVPSGKEFTRDCFLYATDDNIYAVTTYSQEFYRFTRTGSVTKLATLPSEIGQVPMKVMELNGGTIGVMMRGDAIFSIEKDGSSYSKIFTQSFEKGSAPEDMVQTFDGWIYVAATMGGANSKGVIYKIRGDGTSYTKVHEYNGQDGDTPNTIIFRKQAQFITFDPIPTKKILDTPFAPQATSSSGARIYFTSSNSSVAVIEDGKIKIMGLGTATITASVPENANYFKAPDVQRELVVEKNTQTITFDPLPTKKVLDPPFVPQATSSSGAPIIFTSNNSSVAVIMEDKIKIVGVGTVIITASVPENANYFKAPDVQRELVVEKNTQVITFQNPGEKTLGNSPFQIQATSTSELNVSFSTTSDKILISGSSVTILKAGETFIDATQGGNDLFHAAPTVTNTFCVNPPKPVITASGIAPNVILTSSNATGNQWYFNNELLNGSSEKTLEVTAEGSYSVVTKAEVCVSNPSTPYIFRITGLNTDPEISFKVYPNPTREDIIIELTGRFAKKIRIDLIDPMGRTIGTKELAEGTAVFNIRNEGTGMYLIRATAGKYVIMRKVIKQ